MRPSDDTRTPAALIDTQRMQRNIERMQSRMNTLGVRFRLSAESAGHWSGSGGDASVFGLNISQLMRVVDHLREENMLDCLRMLH